MKQFRYFFAAVLAVCLCCCDGCCDDNDDKGDVISLAVDIFKARLDFERDVNKMEPQILDTRSVEDYEAGHIPGAINIDASDNRAWMDATSEFMTKLKATFQQGQKLYIYNNSGWSPIGMALPGEISKIWGRENTIILECGFPGWKEAYPDSVVTGKEPR